MPIPIATWAERTVNLGSTAEVNGVITTATGSPFGSATSGIQLNGGKILVDGTAATATNTIVGDVSFTRRWRDHR